MKKALILGASALRTTPEKSRPGGAQTGPPYPLPNTPPHTPRDTTRRGEAGRTRAPGWEREVCNVDKSATFFALVRIYMAQSCSPPAEWLRMLSLEPRLKIVQHYLANVESRPSPTQPALPFTSPNLRHTTPLLFRLSTTLRRSPF